MIRKVSYARHNHIIQKNKESTLYVLVALKRDNVQTSLDECIRIEISVKNLLTICQWRCYYTNILKERRRTFGRIWKKST